MKKAKIVFKIPKITFHWRHWTFIIPLLILCGLFYYFILRDLPSPVKLASSSIPQSTQIFDRNGILLYTIYGQKNQTFLPLSKIPKISQEASIAIEDKDFYHHGPIDIRGIARALYVNFFHKSVQQGGSTITQQLVKNSLLTQDRTVVRKIKEIILSFATELVYSKNQILELYLNQIPYGGTSYGIEAASEAYFGKHAKDLDLAEAALLAGLPEAPSTYSPLGSHPELAKQRQLDVLAAMQEQGYISKVQQQKAAKEVLNYSKVTNGIKAPHFVLYVKDLLTQKYGEQVVEQGGLKVTTSLDLRIQDLTQQAVADEVNKIKYYHVTNGAAVVTNPATGEILAMVGSRDYFDTEIDGNVNVAIAHRQPGSSIKPINYADGIIHGYTAATPFIDGPVCFPNPGHAPYCPVNYDGKFHGLVQMRFALGNSFNIPAVKMLKANGVDSMIQLANQMGISTFNNAVDYGLSLTLGGGEVTMTDMATAYGTFANGGYRIDLHPLLQVTDSKGRVLESYTPPNNPIFGKKVLPDGVSYIISDILSDNGARLQEFGGSSALYIPGQVVPVKTGTTNDFRDNWTIGYTPKYVVATWVGNNDNTPMGGIASGITGAAPIWHDVMVQLLKDNPAGPLTRPSNVVSKAVCSTTGELAQNPPTCPTRFEYFIQGTEIKQAKAVQETVWVDKSTQQLAAAGQTANIEAKPETTIIDPNGDKFCLTCPAPSPTPSPTP